MPPLSFTAAAAIYAHRIVAATDTEGVVAQGAADTDALIGVTGPRGTEAADRRVDVFLGGPQQVTAGGVFAFGDPVTSDAEGKAVAAAPETGVNARIIGIALETGAADALTRILILPGVMQGA